MGKNFKALMEEFNSIKGKLSEAYIFDDQEQMGGEEYMGDQEMGGDMQIQPQAQPQEDSEEEKAMRAQEIIKHEPIVAKIRETAIEGLRKYSDNPTSDLYNYFKSVFLDSDKLLTKSESGK